jgi:ethanolamine ammonia-lyase small subunit
MSKDLSRPSAEDPWRILTQFTPARIALGRAGMSLPTAAHLDFQLAHALARDAVAVPLDFSELEQAMQQQGYETLLLQTQADTHQAYLQRPDLGRLLNPISADCLRQAALQRTAPDIAVIVADGLSSKAIEGHAEPFLRLLIPQLHDSGYAMAPICLVKHGRVAIGDAIAEMLSARLCVVLIGERPGLSSPDSMGIYFTYRAKSGSTDAERNCISNIHRHGLSYRQALQKLCYLLGKADRLGYSGVHLKDESAGTAIEQRQRSGNFLLE